MKCPCSALIRYGRAQRELLGTRVNGVVAAELREKGWSRICSLAPKVA